MAGKEPQSEDRGGPGGPVTTERADVPVWYRVSQRHQGSLYFRDLRKQRRPWGTYGDHELSQLQTRFSGLNRTL